MIFHFISTGKNLSMSDKPSVGEVRKKQVLVSEKQVSVLVRVNLYNYSGEQLSTFCKGEMHKPDNLL